MSFIMRVAIPLDGYAGAAVRWTLVGKIPTARSDMAVTVEKISIALPPEMVAQVRQAVETGEYASSSEVVRDALRDWTYKRRLQQKGLEELRELWLEARKDNTPGVPAEDVLDRLERKYQAIADATGTAK